MQSIQQDEILSLPPPPTPPSKPLENIDAEYEWIDGMESWWQGLKKEQQDRASELYTAELNRFLTILPYIPVWENAIMMAEYQYQWSALVTAISTWNPNLHVTHGTTTLQLVQIIADHIQEKYPELVRDAPLPAVLSTSAIAFEPLIRWMDERHFFPETFIGFTQLEQYRAKWKISPSDPVALRELLQFKELNSKAEELTREKMDARFQDAQHYSLKFIGLKAGEKNARNARNARDKLEKHGLLKDLPPGRIGAGGRLEYPTPTAREIAWTTYTAKPRGIPGQKLKAKPKAQGK